MRRRRWPLAALVVVALGSVALIGAGCSSAPASTGSSGGNAIHAKAMQFAQCMRSNGVSDFPDPSASGAFTIDVVANGSSLDTHSAVFNQAISACKELEPAGFMGAKRSPAQQAAALKFAQCMRDNGVTDFPDPVNGEPLIDTNRIPSAATSAGMTILHAAMQKCSGFSAQAGVSRP